MGKRMEVWATSTRGEGKKDWWTRAGTAFENRDGSWSLMLDVLPTNGKLIMREEQQRETRDDLPPRRGARAASPSRDDGPDYTRGGDDDIPF